MKSLSQSEYGELRSLYQQVYASNDEIFVDDLSEELVEEIFEELVNEYVLEGYEIEEVLDVVEEAALDFIEAKVTYGHDTEAPKGPEKKSMLQGRIRYAKRKAGEVVKAGKEKVKTAKAVGSIAASIAKDEARRAGRAGQQAVVGAVQKKKEQVKQGVRGLIGKGLRKAAGAVGKVAQKTAGAASRLGEEYVDEATAMAKRGYDEAPIRQKIAKSTGGGEAADRATKLADRPTFGNDKAAKQRQDLARKQRGDFRKTTSSSPGLHGYGHKSDDPKVKAKQAARGAQRGALTPAEKKQLNMEMEYDVFDMVMEFLYVEGYAETLEEAEWMMANLIDEEAVAIIVEASCEDDEEGEKEMKKGKKSKKEEEDEDEEEEELDEATYSAKAARAGKDIGKPGKAFAKIAKSAAKRYGSKERGEKVAGAVLAKLRASKG